MDGERGFAARPLTARALLAAAVVGLAAIAGAGGSDAAQSSHCHGNAHLRHSGAVGFSFSCGSDEPTSFRIRANHRLASVNDPSGVFACERHSVRSFDCNDTHSSAPPSASGELRVSRSVCDPHLVLRVKPRLNFDHWGTRFKVHGPC